MYFGVDTLFKEMSELIFLELRSETLRDGYYISAILFNDENLLQGIILHRSISEALLPMIPGTYSTLSEKPEVILKEENSVLSSWRHVMTYICDFLPDAFFTRKNADKHPNIHVTGAGLSQLNGIYNLYGVRDGVGSYTNGFCFLERQEELKLWFFSVGYVDRKSKQWNSISFYHVKSDADHPPSTGWEASRNKYLPAPILASSKF
jgi:hypothetical protein